MVGPCPDGRGDSTVRRGDGQHAQVRHVLPGIDLAVTDQRHAPPRLELHGLAGQVIVDIAETALHVGAGCEHLPHQAHAPRTKLRQTARDVDQPHVANGREDRRQLHEGRIQVHGQRIVDQVLAGLFSHLQQRAVRHCFIHDQAFEVGPEPVVILHAEHTLVFGSERRVIDDPVRHAHVVSQFDETGGIHQMLLQRLDAKPQGTACMRDTSHGEALAGRRDAEDAFRTVEHVFLAFLRPHLHI